MEANLRTRKRKSPSSPSPFTGIFTRSKSQIYLHRNRSGRARSDTVRKHHHHVNLHSSEEPSRKRRARNERCEASGSDDISYISIKDLRARRVFSPASIVEDGCCPNGSVGDFHLGVGRKVKNSNRVGSDSGEAKLPGMNAEVENFDLGSCVAGKFDNRNPNLQLMIDHGYAVGDHVDGTCEGAREPLENRLNERFEEGFSCKAKDFDVASPNLSERRREEGIFDVESDDGKSESPTEEPIQITPPHKGSIPNEPKLDENHGKRGDLNGSIDQRKGLISRNKMVFNSCSRSKVFKTPSSFSYRRLLPFLMEVATDDPCNSGVSKIENFGSVVSCKDQNLSGTMPELSSIRDNFCSPKDEDGNADSDSRKKPSENGKNKNIDAELFHKAHDLSPTNLSEAGRNKILLNVGQKSNDHGDLSNGFEEYVQMTPPDIDIFSKPEGNDNRGNKEDIDSQTASHILGKPMKGSIGRNDRFASETRHKIVNRRNGSTLKSELILNPCSQMKVFKIPSSFSYRRMLPFLRDVKIDGSHHSLDASKCTQDRKVDSVLEERNHLPVIASQSREISMDTCKTDCSSPIEYHHVCDSEPNQLTSDNGSSNKELTLTSAKDFTELHMPIDSYKECMSEVEHVMLNKPVSLEPVPDRVSSNLEVEAAAKPLLFPANCETLHRDDALEFSNCVSIASQEECTELQKEHSEDAKSIEAVSLDENASQPEAFIPSGIPVAGLTKGILKRNPQGCIGLRNCLNCASFRLQADRAFEFSRHRMQDAEEMALELIKELSCIRNMLEKSTVDANDIGIVHISQVKEACTKAFKAEELARSRLSQMNCDLSIHCRSMPLRVKFANHVEEIIIPKADSQCG